MEDNWLLVTCAIAFCVLFILSYLVHILEMLRALIYHKLGARSSNTLHILQESVLNRRCTLTDLDIFWHMNNAIYLKHCDQARVKLWMYNGVWDIVFKAGGSMVVGACSNRYRRPLTLFQAYDLRSKVIYWDDSAFYVEHTFVRTSDNFICFVALIKQTVTGIKVSEVLQKLSYAVEKPDPLPELQKWIDSLKLSSGRLGKKA